MFLVELVGEDLLLRPTIRAFAGEGFQIFELFMTRAVHGVCHGFLLLKIA